MPFHGRRRELAVLDEAYERAEGQMFVLYGRRGVGKTVLLGHWLESREHRHFFWTADQRSAPVLLRSLSQAITAFVEPGRSIPAEFTYSSWEMALDEIARLAQHERLVVVLDEFTYLMAADPSLPSILQRVWDHKLKRSNLMLVITGSHAGMIERQVLAYRAPLYHRASASLHLQPLPYGNLADFFPRYTPEERVQVYACVGGVPKYLELMRPERPLEDNLKSLLGSKLIIDDAGALLRDQLNEPSQCISILEAIAAGFDQYSDIAAMAGLPVSHLGKYLSMLKRLGIVTREVPVTETKPEKSRKGRYRITDHYLRFYYRFLANQRANLERGLINPVWLNIRQHLAEFVGAHVFEELCREYLLQLGNAGRLTFMPREVGSFWGSRLPQIDVVAINEDAHRLILGECKWTGKPIEAAIVTSLIERAQRVIPAPVEKWSVTYAFFSKSGFAPDARSAAAGRQCMWVTLEQIDSALRQV
jgi:AAA+ ATPase superfamily predicted ATPase